MNLVTLIVQGGFFCGLGGALRGALGILKTLKENPSGAISTETLWQRFKRIVDVTQYSWSIVVSALGGITLALISCYTLGMGVVEACSLTTLALVSLGWTGVDGIETLFGTLLKK
jgi:hypothetical protein